VCTSQGLIYVHIKFQSSNLHRLNNDTPHLMRNTYLAWPSRIVLRYTIKNNTDKLLMLVK